jgi:hypothetical protein
MAIEPMPEELTRAVEEFLDAFECLDFERFAAGFIQNNDVSMIFPDQATRLIYRGWFSVEHAWKEIFQSERLNSQNGKIKLEVSDLGIQRYGNSAIVTFLVNSSPPAIVHRRTIIFVRGNGRWLIAHLHGSNYDQK